MRTVQGYHGLLKHFFAALSKPSDRETNLMALALEGAVFSPRRVAFGDKDGIR